MSGNQDYRPPKASAGDRAHSAIRAAVGAVPYVGAAGMELFSALVSPPLERRQDQWMEEVGEVLGRLQQEGRVRVEDLSNNDAFVDTMLHASHIAMRNSEKEKREQLRNAVLNAALPKPPDRSIQQVFLGFVDTFTVWHVRALAVLDNPVKWFRAGDRPVPTPTEHLEDLIEAAFPELRGKREFTQLLLRDLAGRGLIVGQEKGTVFVVPSIPENQTTQLGMEFLKFITDPLESG